MSQPPLSLTTGHLAMKVAGVESKNSDQERENPIHKSEMERFLLPAPQRGQEAQVTTAHATIGCVCTL